SDNIGIEPCYSYQGGHIGDFDIATDIWDPGVTGRALDCTLPIILHTDKTYVEVSPFESEVYSIINNKYVKNNATFINKTLKLKLNNANITSTNLSNISITKLTTGTNIAPYFEFEFNNNILTIAMINNLSGNFTGDYLVTIPCADTTIYRLIEIQDVATFTITYHLDGGTASNPDVYTNKQTSLSLNNPIKPGFTFVGWYTDSNFTLSFNPNSLPYTNLVLYAKYDFASPAVVNKSNDISITYYKDLEITISILATHHLLNDYNTLTYQWYKSATANGTFTIIDQANTPSLTLNAVNQSGYYACEITVIIMDTSMVSTPCTKTLSIGPSNTISVNIKPYIYDMSNVKWNYTEAFSYDTTIHSVELINLPSGITATYTNNSSSEINTYTAHATLVYDDMEGNAFANNIEDLTWEIRKAQITITINDIYSTEHLSQDILNSTYSCHIDNEYLPSGIIDLEDKIAYLNLQYSLQSTSNDCSKIISATTNSFDIYNISIINGEYRVVVHTLTNNDIIATNNKGFVQNCTFNATTHNATSDTKQLLKDKDLTLVDAYDFNFSYLKDDEASITIPIDRAELLNGLSVYMLKNGELIKVDTTISSQGLIFNTIEQEATYLIVKNNIINSNNDMIILTVIISIYIGLFICAIINTIKHKHNYY
ncbi:MAG: InlB B-repeat-containing protein, partial [Clostridia bacterium]|nr:InlB B-repeat-containing protein [Clostridia bacterium]